MKAERVEFIADNRDVEESEPPIEVASRGSLRRASPSLDQADTRRQRRTLFSPAFATAASEIAGTTKRTIRTMLIEFSSARFAFKATLTQTPSPRAKSPLP